MQIVDCQAKKFILSQQKVNYKLIIFADSAIGTFWRETGGNLAQSALSIYPRINKVKMDYKDIGHITRGVFVSSLVVCIVNVKVPKWLF